MGSEHVAAMREIGGRLADAVIPRGLASMSPELRIGALGEMRLPDCGKVIVGAYGFLGMVVPGGDGRPVLYDFGEGSAACRDGLHREYVAAFREAGWPVVAVYDKAVKDRLWNESRVPCLEHGEAAEHLLRVNGALEATEDFLDGRVDAVAGLVAWGGRRTERSGRIVLPCASPAPVMDTVPFGR